MALVPALQRWLCVGAVGCLSVAGGGAALRSEAAPVEEVIAFDGVQVEGVGGPAEAPEAAHRDAAGDLAGGAGAAAGADAGGSGGEARSGDSREERILDIALDLRLVIRLEDRDRHVYVERNQGLGFGHAAAVETLKKNPTWADELEYAANQIRPGWKKSIRPPAPVALPVSPREFAPGQPAAANPSFVEGGFRVEAFWAARTGTPAGRFVRAHFHPPDLSTGFEAQHLGGRTELHGLYIRSMDGRPFWVKRLRYRVTRNRQLPTKPYSIGGFNNFSVQVLVARAFDPRRSVREQFQGFPVGPPLGNDLSLPWQTLHVFGFEFVQEVYIASSGSVDIDDIALVPFGAAR